LFFEKYHKFDICRKTFCLALYMHQDIKEIEVEPQVQILTKVMLAILPRAARRPRNRLCFMTRDRARDFHSPFSSPRTLIKTVKLHERTSAAYSQAKFRKCLKREKLSSKIGIFCREENTRKHTSKILIWYRGSMQGDIVISGAVQCTFFPACRSKRNDTRRLRCRCRCCCCRTR
jgi:hypothetical protein